MEFTWTRQHTPEGETFSFSGKVGILDVLNLRLTPLDRALLNDVGSDEKATAADVLLVLEMLFRRSQEKAAHHSRAASSEPRRLA